jgi:myo-inositol 2-dehydrogenase/D-chiro-inositol 1-dehydrogenase
LRGVLDHNCDSGWRQCACGFDQRVAAFGTAGRVQIVNRRDDPVVRWSATQTEARKPLKHFFRERHDASFYHALDEFHGAVNQDRAPSASQADGREALAIALACALSAKTGKSVSPDNEYDGWTQCGV